MRGTNVIVLIASILLSCISLWSQDTCTVNGIYINSLLVDPTGLLEDYDTNGDGRPDSNDEYIELCNASQDTLDIGAWTISDDDPPPGPDFSFPDSTLIAPGQCILLVANYCPNDSQACVPPPGVIDMDLEFLGLLANGGDLVVLSDTTGLSCAVSYGNFSCEDVDPLDVPGFDPALCEDWDTDVDGCPLLMIGDSCAYVPQALPLGLMDFRVVRGSSGQVRLSWEMDSNAIPDFFEIEWATALSGPTRTIAVLAQDEHMPGENHFEYTHQSALQGLNYYRLKARTSGQLHWQSEFRVIKIEEKLKFSVYPNPVSDRLFIGGNVDWKELKIFNLSGELIDKFLPKTDFEFLDLTSLPDGIYVIQVFDGYKISNSKFVKI